MATNGTIVTLLKMDITEATTFIAANHRAVLVTLRNDGKPQLSPITAGVDDAGHVVISSARDGDEDTQSPEASLRLAVRVQ